jgi:diketogulonate reductase-like aldo/keto reductase
MKTKKAIITLELIDESVDETDKKIAQELLNWLLEDAISIPWVKSVKDVIVKDP